VGEGEEEKEVEIREEMEKAVKGSILFTPSHFSPFFLSLPSPSPAFQTLITVAPETTLQAAKRLHLLYSSSEAEEKGKEEAEEQEGKGKEKEKEKEKGKEKAGEEEEKRGRRKRSMNITALNFASAKNPGGGFQGGAQAQEESLARSSALYPCIAQMAEMYGENRKCKTCAYFHYMVYSPAVPVFREDSGELLPSPYPLSIITAPAPNAGVMQTRIKGNAGEEIERVLGERIDRILAVAMHQRADVLILGAYGCGVFRNDVTVVARLFSQMLLGKYKGAFRHVHFAVPDRHGVFRAVFGLQQEGQDGIN